MNLWRMIWASVLLVLSIAISNAMSGRRLCGKALADMLDMVCYRRGFHWQSRLKRSIPSVAKRTAVQYLTTTTALPEPEPELGIVGECCYKSCTLSDLESYCAVPAGTELPNPTNSPLTNEIAKALINPFRGKTYRRFTEVNQPSTTTTTTVLPPTTTTTDSANIGFGENFPSGKSASLLSRLAQARLSGSRLSRFFFVRPVGPRPTRAPRPY